MVNVVNGRKSISSIPAWADLHPTSTRSFSGSAAQHVGRLDVSTPDVDMVLLKNLALTARRRYRA